MMATPTRTLRRSLSPEAVMAEDAETKPVHTRIEDGPPYWSSVATPSPPPRRGRPAHGALARAAIDARFRDGYLRGVYL